MASTLLLMIRSSTQRASAFYHVDVTSSLLHGVSEARKQYPSTVQVGRNTPRHLLLARDLALLRNAIAATNVNENYTDLPDQAHAQSRIIILLLTANPAKTCAVPLCMTKMSA